MSDIAESLPLCADLAGSAVFVEAASGPARTAVLQHWVADARAGGVIATYVSGDVDVHGVWAGLDQLLWSILPRVREVAPELVERHSYELCLVLPALRRELFVKNPCLTDIATAEEKVRNYPNDRAYRSLQGLVDFMDAWHAIEPWTGWAIACDCFDSTTSLVRRFFAELLRRRGAELRLALVLAVDIGQREDAQSLFQASRVLPPVVLDLPAAEPADMPSASEAGRRADELEQRIGQDRIEWSIHIPRLLSLWQQSDTPERALPWLMRAINTYDHDGLYEIAVRYADAVETNLDRMFASDPQLHALAVLNLFFCYTALGRVEDGYRILRDHGLPKITDPVILVDVHYFLGMLHARFRRERDFDLATAHLEEAIALIEGLEVPESRRHFLRVFVRNGLAYVRFRQGRAAEALELCDSGLAELDAVLRPDEHRLHRSVLLYNGAQVLAALDRSEQAITTLSRAMDMDPNYSEYYLERGALLLKLERLEEAERDLVRAIELSPPYPEAWTNLGQCYRAAGRLQEAEHAYNMALDLDPRVNLALTGRADVLFERGELVGALADYSAALAVQPEQPLVMAARAIANFEAGRIGEAINDLDGAIQLAPETAELYQNRAIALAEAGRAGAARADLQLYLRLRPDAEDRADVERQLMSLAT
jgi:tetratricopeptide (TPR) repeat protein